MAMATLASGRNNGIPVARTLECFSALEIRIPLSRLEIKKYIRNDNKLVRIMMFIMLTRFEA